ncbi:MAG TPA: hypothetical protein P5307_28315, partial [Pirellulaceae bacterium]|nr:hypothetical protein [Pirellulaceae bacterium]
YTWAYNSTSGSLFAVVVLHGATVAVPSMSATPGFANEVIAPLLYPIIAIGLVWRYGAANLFWRDRVIAEPPNWHADHKLITEGEAMNGKNYEP